MSGTDQKLKTVAIDSTITAGSQSQAKSLSYLATPKSSKGFSLSRMRIRKQSYGFSSVPGVGGQMRKRSSQTGLEYRRPPLIYLNTYQLEPRVRFNVTEVTNSVNSILDAFYTDFKYNAMEAPIKIMLIADEVMRTVKEMKFNRFRIISVVTLMQKRAQSYNNAVAFLWDHEFDSIVNVQREEHTSLIQVTVFGVYLD
ncbi:hypothetical protein PYW08_003684 [Mythimna loreyi]|uniref:Uncharacterized protein n=1 Tax=Mythimna loreyi TaxID=667449 RepID=A0ACC2QTX1_9NEOP|nr:hypothetical protein PYW08_003684 [Mythimna loreyi]